MGMAEIATALWKNHLNHNPLNPHWFNRDRFVYPTVMDQCFSIAYCI